MSPRVGRGGGKWGGEVGGGGEEEEEGLAVVGGVCAFIDLAPPVVCCALCKGMDGYSSR